MLAAGAVLVVALMNFTAIKLELKRFATILQPVFWGFVIAYLLTPLEKRLEAWALPLLKGKGKPDAKKEARTVKAARAIAVGLSLMVAVIIVWGMIALVFPSLVESIEGIVVNLSSYYKNLETWVRGILDNNNEISQYADTILQKAYELLDSWLNNDLMPSINGLVASVTTGIVDFVKALINVIIGAIISVYIMMSRDKFTGQSKKLAYAVFSTERANALIEVARYSNKVFGGFIMGKLIDSFIIGVLCFICMTVMQLPFPMLISIIVGVTNVIPFFGPYIGAIPSAFLILVVNPIQCLYFVIFILILQQIDGNIIGPRILGDATGLSSFWVVVSILVFGGIFGIAGMVIGVPTFAVLYTLIVRAVNRKLKSKDMTEQTEAYTELAYIDEENGRFVSHAQADAQKDEQESSDSTQGG